MSNLTRSTFAATAVPAANVAAKAKALTPASTLRFVHHCMCVHSPSCSAANRQHRDGPNRGPKSSGPACLRQTVLGEISPSRNELYPVDSAVRRVRELYPHRDINSQEDLWLGRNRKAFKWVGTKEAQLVVCGNERSAITHMHVRDFHSRSCSAEHEDDRADLEPSIRDDDRRRDRKVKPVVASDLLD